MKNQDYKLFNYNSSKQFNRTCLNLPSIDYAQMYEFRFKSCLQLKMNNKKYFLIVLRSFTTNTAILAQIWEESNRSGHDDILNKPERMMAFYIEHNIKEDEFKTFINSLPSTEKNGKFLYSKAFMDLKVLG